MTSKVSLTRGVLSSLDVSDFCFSWLILEGSWAGIGRAVRPPLKPVTTI